MTPTAKRTGFSHGTGAGAGSHLVDAARLVARASGPALATDLDGLITDWNRRAAELLGHSPSHATARDLIDLLRPTDYFGNAYSVTAGTLADQAITGQAVHAFELDLCTSDGRKVRVSVSLILLLRSNHEECRAVYLLSPVLRRRRTDEALDRILGERSVSRVPRRRASDPAPALTQRQREVLRLLVDGLSTPAIAARIGISVHTVRNHVQLIYRRLGAKNRAEAVAKALSSHSL